MIKRVDGYEIHNDQPKANIILTNEVNAIHNDIWICLDGNRSIFKPDQTAKNALYSLYKTLERYKQEGRI